MKLTLFISSILISFHCISQDLNNLDRKMGFNKFKLETPYENYKSFLKLRIISRNNIKFYDYVGKDISSIFGVRYEKITLGFYKNRLYTISITFNYTSAEEDEILQNKLKELFGWTRKEYNVITDGGVEYEWAMKWVSKKVEMQLERYKSGSYNSAPWSTEIFINSKKLSAEILNDSF